MAVDEIYLVHHTHLDIGFTHDQPIAWDLHRRFIDRAIELAERDLDDDSPAAFRWTIEATSPLLWWLRRADEEQIDRLQAVAAEGRIDVAGMLAHFKSVYDQSELVESLRPLKTLREEYGFDVRYAMNCDINGNSWPLADRLLDAGIEGLVMSINTFVGGAYPDPRVQLFDWAGPSGRTLPSFVAFQYGGGYAFGIGRDASLFAETWWPAIEAYLEEIEFPFSKLLIQTTGPFYDNNPPFDGLTHFVREWNQRPAVERGDQPRLRIATLTDWWDALDTDDVDVPTRRGDWSDYWHSQVISASGEMGINRENRRRLRTADAIEAGLTGLGAGPSQRSPMRRAPLDQRDQAWWNVHFFDEHSWGADVSSGEDQTTQWHHHAQYAYEARSQSLMQQRDAVAELARRVPGGDVE